MEPFTIQYSCNGPRVYRIGNETVAITSGEIPGRADAEYLGHRGCGHDLTRLILDIPPDGRPRIVVCPACETVGTHLRTPPDVPED